MEIISAWELYLWTRLDSVSSLFYMLGFICGVTYATVFAVSGLASALDGSQVGKEVNTRLRSKSVIFGLLVLLLLSVSIPNKKEAAMIYVVPKLANSQQLQKEAGEIYTMAKEYMKESLDLDKDTKGTK